MLVKLTLEFLPSCPAVSIATLQSLFVGWLMFFAATANWRSVEIVAAWCECILLNSLLAQKPNSMNQSFHKIL